MSVFELLAPSKPWTDLHVNSINSKFSLRSGYANTYLAGPIVLTAQQAVGGIIGVVTSTLNVPITLPSGASLDSYLGSDVGVSFLLSIYCGPNTTAAVTLGAGTGHFAGSVSFTVESTVPKFINYVRTSLGWVVYVSYTPP